MTHSKTRIPVPWRVGLSLLPLFSSMSLACQSPREAQVQEQARMLVDQLQMLDANAEAEVRKRALDKLAALPLQDAEARELRDTCSRAHRGLLTAQGFQAQARAGLMEAERLAGPDGVAPGAAEHTEVAVAVGEATSPSAVAALEAALSLSKSEEALASAKVDLARCRELSGPFLRKHR